MNGANSSLDKLSKHQIAGRGAIQKNGPQPVGAARSNSQMLDKPIAPDQQGVRDFLTEGVTSITALEMHRVLENCGYEHQRGISEQHVTVLCDLMKRGRWQPKSQIDFAVLNGRYILVNGYHRGYGQVRSGKTVAWSIALHPVKTEADLRSLYHAFDTNIRMRGAADILKAAEFGAVTGVTGEVAKSLYAAVPYLAAKFIMDKKSRNFLIERQVDRRLEIAEQYAKAANRLGAAIEGMPGNRRLKFKSGAVTAVAVATFRYQSDAAWQFWTGVAHMDGLKRGDPRLALASDFLARKINSARLESFAPAMIAWNAFFNDRELRIIKVLDTFAPIIDGTPFDGKPVKVA